MEYIFWNTTHFYMFNQVRYNKFLYKKKVFGEGLFGYTKYLN